MLRKEEVRLIVNLDDLRDYNREYADGSVSFFPLRCCHRGLDCLGDSA
jgi:hypothetical protein